MPEVDPPLPRLCSGCAAGISSATCVFCRRRSGMPPPFFGARLGHIAGCTALIQSVCAFALQLRQRRPWRLWPRNTWPHASHGVIFRYVYSRQTCPPSESRLLLKSQDHLCSSAGHVTLPAPERCGISLLSVIVCHTRVGVRSCVKPQKRRMQE